MILYKLFITLVFLVAGTIIVSVGFTLLKEDTYATNGERIKRIGTIILGFIAMFIGAVIWL
jgi:hypothetical protein